ncbi:MAG: ATP-binding protein [Deinococcales bacterium]
MVQLYALKNDNEEVERYLQLFLAHANEHTPYFNWANIYQEASNFYEKNNQTAKACIYLKKYLELEQARSQKIFDDQYQHYNSLFNVKGIEQEKALAFTKAQQAQQEAEKERLRNEELAKAKKQAEAANEAKSLFIASVSHELRTPLNSIMGFTRVLQRSAERLVLEDHHKPLKIISKSSEHLLDLINDILDTAKLEAGKADLELGIVHLPSFINDITQLFVDRFEEAGLDFQVIYDEALPNYVQADERKLRQVILNLLSNALKFTHQGSVYLALDDKSLDGDEVSLTIRVSDTGEGIAETELHKLFEAFTQTATGIKSRKGTGLGLSIAQAFCKLMGTNLEVTSKLGEGTSFSFRPSFLLARAQDYQQKAIVKLPLALAEGQAQKKIVIADDRDENRLLLSNLLKPYGFLIKEASNGQEVIDLFKMWQPHLIFLDMRMPVLDGFEATKYIKQFSQGQATAVIAVTASVLGRGKGLVLEAGCDGYIMKPYQDIEVIRALEKHLGLKFIYQEVRVKELDQKDIELRLKEEWLNFGEDVRQQILEAAELADGQTLREVLELLKSQCPHFAQRISSYLSWYQYEEIIQLISKYSKF